MAVEILSPSLDPNRVRPSAPVGYSKMLRPLIKMINWCYAALGQGVAGDEFEPAAATPGSGVHQGTGSAISTTADGSYVVRLEAHYRARATSTNNNLLVFEVVALAETASGTVRAKVYTLAGTLTETLDCAITTGAERQVTAAAASTALDGAVDYYVQISMATTGSLKLRRWSLYEADIAAAALP
mgnify:CR=1 FL=1